MKSRKIFRNRSIDFNFLNFKKDSNSNWRKKRLIDNFLSKNNNIIMMIATRERLVFSSTYSHRIIGQNSQFCSRTKDYYQLQQKPRCLYRIFST